MPSQDIGSQIKGLPGFVDAIISLSPQTKIRYSAFVVLLYLILFYPLYKVMGRNVSILVAVLCTVAPLFFGLRVGLITWFISMAILNPVMLKVFTDSTFSQAFNAGYFGGSLAGLFVTVIVGVLHSLLSQINNLNTKLYDLSRVDFLTNLFNRRAFFDSARRELKRAHRQKSDATYFLNEMKSSLNKEGQEEFKSQRDISDYVGSFSVAILDFDFFKKINDTYGHITGDKVLKFFGELVNNRSILRETDISGRFGGEEFIICFPGTSARNAVFPIEKLREGFKNNVFTSESGENFSISFSCGISELHDDKDSLDTIVAEADDALYKAKNSGRDCTVIHDLS